METPLTEETENVYVDEDDSPNPELQIYACNAKIKGWKGQSIWSQYWLNYSDQ